LGCKKVLWGEHPPVGGVDNSLHYNAIIQYRCHISGVPWVMASVCRL